MWYSYAHTPTMGNRLSASRARKPKSDSSVPNNLTAVSTPAAGTDQHMTSSTPNNPTAVFNAGYWASWKVYDGMFPSIIDPKTITHLLYAFADIDGDGSVHLKEEHLHYSIDIDGVYGGLRACTRLKQQNPDLEVLVSIGGGEASASGQFLDIAGHPHKIRRLAESARNLVELFSLDGVDIDWEHISTKEEGSQYLRLMEAVRKALPRYDDYLVTTAIPADPSVLQHICLSELADQVDLLNLMAYDFVGPTYASVTVTDHHAQLFDPKAQLRRQRQSMSGATAVDYLIERGFPAYKIVLGIPTYVHGFAATRGLYKPFGKASKHDEAPVRELPKPGMEEIYDKDAVAVFAQGNGEFLTYDNKISVAEKARYVKQRGLAGLFYWQLAADRVGEESLVRSGFEVLMTCFAERSP